MRPSMLPLFGLPLLCANSLFSDSDVEPAPRRNDVAARRLRCLASDGVSSVLGWQSAGSARRPDAVCGDRLGHLRTHRSIAATGTGGIGPGRTGHSLGVAGRTGHRPTGPPRGDRQFPAGDGGLFAGFGRHFVVPSGLSLDLCLPVCQRGGTRVSAARQVGPVAADCAAQPICECRDVEHLRLSARDRGRPGARRAVDRGDAVGGVGLRAHRPADHGLGRGRGSHSPASSPRRARNDWDWPVCWQA